MKSRIKKFVKDHQEELIILCGLIAAVILVALFGKKTDQTTMTRSEQEAYWKEELSLLKVEYPELSVELDSAYSEL